MALLTKNPKGLLSSTSEEEVKYQNKGTLPQSPMGASTLGANPDQAKMIGSSANKANALRQAVQTDDLTTFQRTKQTPVQPLDPAAEAKKNLLNAAIGFTGNLNDRVNVLKNQAFANAQTTPGTITPKMEQFGEDLPPETTPEMRTAAEAAFGRMAQGVATTEDIIAIAKALGKTKLTPEDLAPYVEGDPAVIANQLSRNKVTVNDLYGIDATEEDLQELQNLSTLLGFDEDELRSMDTDQLQNAIKDEQARSFNQADSLRRILQDPGANENERQQARQLLRELGASGVAATEQTANTLDEKIEQGLQVNIAGEKMDITSALQEENIQGLIKRWFEEPGFKEKMETQEPGLAETIKANEEEWARIAAEIPNSLKEYSTIQEHNEAQAKTASGAELSKDVMKAIFPDWGTPRGEQYQTPPLLQVLQSDAVPAEERVRLQEALGNISSRNPELVQQLSQMGYEQLAKYGLTTQKGLQNLQNNIQSYNELANINPTANPSYVYSQAFGMSPTDIQSKLATLTAQAKFGFADADSKKFLQMVDANGDGKMDAIEDIHARVMQNFGGDISNLQGLLDRKVTSSKDLAAAGINNGKNVPAEYTNVVDKFSTAFADGKVSDAELLKVTGKNGESMSFEDLLKARKVLPGTVINGVIDAKATQMASPYIADILPVIKTGFVNASTLGKVTDLQGTFNKIKNDPSVPKEVKLKVEQELGRANTLAQDYKKTIDITSSTIDSVKKTNSHLNLIRDPDWYKLATSLVGGTPPPQAITNLPTTYDSRTHKAMVEYPPGSGRKLELNAASTLHQAEITAYNAAFLKKLQEIQKGNNINLEIINTLKQFSDSRY